MSAYHIVKSLGNLDQAMKATNAHMAKIEAIQNNSSMSKGQRKNALAHLGTPKGDAPDHWAVLWIQHGVNAVDLAYIESADIMLGRLEPFDASWIPEYPVFRDPSVPMRQGTSLVRIGFPFDEFDVSYDSATGYTIRSMQVVTFPIEGIMTREIILGSHPNGYPEAFIETSSPGLKGQSGGPLLDTNGLVWGIQSRTQHLSLGFDPPVPSEDGKKVGSRKEHQFLNVGWATHSATVIGLLKERGVAHNVSA